MSCLFLILDTPGILDHPLEERNTIEMQAITALAHLRAAVLYIVDPSEQCGYSLEAQKSLFDNIKPLFNNKPLIVVANKADIWRDALNEEKQAILKTFEADAENGKIMEMSNKDDDDSVMQVKVDACEILLQHRVELKFKSKKADGILNRIHVAEPQPRDGKVRAAFIPEAALKVNIYFINLISFRNFVIFKKNESNSWYYFFSETNAKIAKEKRRG